LDGLGGKAIATILEKLASILPTQNPLAYYGAYPLTQLLQKKKHNIKK
jgi:hypothetical protein